ncbi:MICOS complex subunit Mic10-like [Amphiura filiformis]|uniref:MICOS complex subunit Mic10-like n=1 Tax=Amphiura filiformis TaxID=82378 RepID=UPI003B21C6A1
MANANRSEDVLGVKWDRCVADTLLKLGGGVAVGVVFSAIVFKRKTWPIFLGAGTGFGMGIANCQHEFRDPYNFRVKVVQKEPTPAVTAEPSPSPPAPTEQNS